MWTEERINQEIEKLSETYTKCEELIKNCTDSNQLNKYINWKNSIYWRVSAYKNVLDEKIEPDDIPRI